MACFAVDQGVSATDFAALSAAVEGDKRALREVCRRFTVPILALALQVSKDLETAVGCVEPTLRRLCSELLSRRFEPQDWSLVLEALVREYGAFRSPSEEGGASLEGITVVQRVVRRRILRQTLPELPLPQLTALLLLHLDGAAPDAMVGLVAGTPTEGQEVVGDAYHRLQCAIDRTPEPDR